MASGQSFTLSIKALFDTSDVKAKVEGIQNILNNIKLPDNLKRSLDSSFINVNKVLDEFNSRVEKGIKSKADATGISKSFDNVIKELNTLDKLMANVKNQLGDGVDLSKIIKIDDSTRNKINQLSQEIANLQKEISKITTDNLNKLQQALQNIKSPAAKKGAQSALDLFEEEKIQESLKLLDQVIVKQQQVQNALAAKGANTTNVDANIKWLTQMRDEIKNNVLPLVENYNSQIGEKATQAANLLNDSQQRTAQGARDLANGLHQVTLGASGAAPRIRELVGAQAQFTREIDQVKSRIQYFFGLSNGINLVKRAIRGAVQTIKELDKAMTATAVVTDFKVSDMWKQLPEYTKRANQLGVTTQAAYEAATLYYQQGLNTEEVNALSVETLKMARIGGLDAAEATDRMTNALRGFNMELNTQSAQRVDDVYSELAANTASNVDEISTAMTKVASLAHSANMEFETTAAFLAQIIETTRESPETAGTALKTVVARFAEVKKLVDEDQLKGQDEEGQVVDVNKVSAALRTAGIDLNKYFLGEVGLDDIFMELASKWNSLTSIQQRYIATQAAGSRQQSRFIALMQDYSRTQELVGKAYNSEGASAKQFEKTEESLESKLARLKNAWNEFLMGLTNSTMVKGFVDILTTILNLVNKITGAFGNGAGSVLKWITAFGVIGGLRRLFVDGGIATRAIAGLMGNNPMATRFRVNAGLGVINQATQQYQAFTPQQLRANRGPTFIGGIGGLGKKAWTGAKNLGAFFGFGQKGALMGGLSGAQLSGSAGLAAGLGGIGVALGAVALAVGAVIAAYQAWLRLTPEGHLKQAKQLAETMNTVANNTQKSASEFKKITENYKDYNNAIKSASTTAEYQKTVSDRTNYVSQLMESNPDIARYVTAKFENDEFTLTINEQELEQAIKDAEKAVSKAAIDASFANALVAGKQADVYATQLAGVNMERQVIYDLVSNEQRALTEEELAKFSPIQTQIETARAQQTAYAQQAFARQLEDSGLDDDLSNLLSNVLAKSFNEDQYLDEINKQRSKNWWRRSDTTKEGLRKEYFLLYGQQADSEMGRKELKKAIATRQVDNKREENTKAAAEAVKSGRYDDILKAIAGEIDFSEAQLKLDETTEKLEDFSEITGISVEDLKTQINQGQKARQEIKKGRQADIFEQALKSGHGINEDFFNTIKGLDFEKLGVVSDIINQAAGKVSEQTFQSLFDSLPDMSNEALQQLQSFFNDFTLDNPIQALDQLNSKIAEVGANSDFGKLLIDIKETNSALFESSNLVQSFLLSESYENLSDSIEKFIKDNKKLNAKNIKEMAESCKELDTLLKEVNEDLGENTDSAQALAEALNLIADGALGIDQITNSLLAALGAGESFETLIGNIQQWIEDFNKGTDLREGVDHITSIAKDALELVKDWQFGNEPLMNTYDHLFSNGAYDTYMRENWDKYSPDQLEKEIGEQIQRISDMAENGGLGALQFLSDKEIGITDKGNNEFEWDLSRYKEQENPVQAAIQDVATQLGVTEDAARAFIEGWASNMWDLRQDWNNLNFIDSMKAFSNELGNQSVITQAELDALMAKTGKTREEILQALEEIRGKGNIPIIVNWQLEDGTPLTGKDLIDKFNEISKSQTTVRYNGSQLESITDYSNFLKDIKNVNRQVKTAFGYTFDTLDYDTLTKHLIEAFKLTPTQANEVADHIAEQTHQKLSKEIKVPVRLDDNTIGTETKVITATTSDGLQAGIDAAMEAANYTLVAEYIADASDFSTVGSKLEDAIKAGANTLPGAISSAAEKVSVAIPIHWKPDPLPTGAGASGGVVKSYASGSAANRLSPGKSLTGELGPEIVWNGKEGYAYITGTHGPQFQDLKPGDRIFNANDTKRILQNHGRQKLFGSYAMEYDGMLRYDGASHGAWKDGPGNPSGGDNSKSSEEWKNELDWLYDLMEDIAEEEHKQTLIQSEYELVEKDLSKTGRDLYNLTKAELETLNTQLEAQQFAFEKRFQQMNELQQKVVAEGFEEYLRWNPEDNSLEIDWDKINEITDKDTYNKLSELVSDMEKVQDQMDEAQEATLDIKKQIQELQTRYLQAYLDFQDKVMEAVVAQYQQNIDSLSELNDTINDANQSILDSIQKEIDLQRQIRDNTDTEKEIADIEARLAMLQRDTTGANQQEILELQKQLDEARENYSDTLVDQAIDRLSQNNDDAQEQRERQIELLEAQLEYWQETGALWEEVADLIATGFTPQGSIIEGSTLWEFLKDKDSWKGLSQAQKDNWANELILESAQVGAYLIQLNDGTEVSADRIIDSIIGEHGLAGEITAETRIVRAQLNELIATLGGTPIDSIPGEEGYASGGLATKTGLAMLHGTVNEPEYVLNARQTGAFLRLADVLPSIFSSGTGATNNYGTNVYVELNMSVGEIGSDYDVDRLVARVKDDIYDASSYRNVNAVSFLR